MRLNVRAALLLVLASCTHGAEEDHSGFVGASLMADGRVALSYAWLTYEPPTGLSTFPDGGTPRYITDIDILATYDMATGAIRVFRREENTRFSHDGAHFFVSQTNGPLVEVSRYPDTRDLKNNVFEEFLLNVDDGTTHDVRYKEKLPANDVGWIGRLASPAGHMVFSTSLPRDPSSEVGQIWVRSPDDTYHFVVDTYHYVAVENGEVIYWVAATRQFKAFNMTTFTTRVLTNYQEPQFVQDTASVRIEGGKVEYGRWMGSEWSYKPLSISTELVRHQAVAKP